MARYPWIVNNSCDSYLPSIFSFYSFYRSFFLFKHRLFTFEANPDSEEQPEEIEISPKVVDLFPVAPSISLLFNYFPAIIMIDAIKGAIGDAVLTSMWIFCASSLGVLTSVLYSVAGVYGIPLHPLFITTTLVFVLVFVFNIIGAALGGASFNPTATAAFYAAGVGPTSLLSMALRFPAQVSIRSLLL